ncbi:acid phosphatase (PhoG) [Cordyceps militaris CM01]|uniref:Acid phosphatase (PhoG) n=1 Tax=Cordyceps militaris (strain CM01) TaxID=983644 RepID=G3JGC0_CORMM|nr:acid phosphatase (PhoG) [Cordyceps militaris CM01]EGX93250.1 acid phosphatase (PhoG) [Cordyceps militaris CM01]
MAAFNSMPVMNATPAQNDTIAMNHARQSMTMDAFDQDLSGFDEALIRHHPVTNDYLSAHLSNSDTGPLPTLPFTPSYDFDNFATTFEDPFSYSTRQYEPTPHQDILNEDASPQDLDNKLLGFSDPVMSTTIVDDSGQFADTTMAAELYGMFFVAEDVFGGETTGRPLELTCYRRNLWQCAGQITLSRAISHIIDEQGRQVPLVELFASINAIESIEGKGTEIISIPWKSSNPQAGEDSKIATAPPNVNIDLSAGQELDANRVSIPVSWKRLQFKHATANNGRRKGLQQHYVVQISLLGKTKNGETIKIAEIQSGPVIVRGRSPRNFDSRKDVPLSGDKRLERKNTSSSDGNALKVEREHLQAAMQRYQSMPGPVIANPNDWATSQPVAQPRESPHPAKRMALSPTVSKPPVPPWNPDAPRTASGHRGSMSRPREAGAPINLSLSEDERSPNRSSAELQSPKLGKSHPAVGQHAASSPTEEADPLYEYFPLSVDDWMPPVDAVYRPHVVHHTYEPIEIFEAKRGKAKRYFLAD